MTAAMPIASPPAPPRPPFGSGLIPRTVAAFLDQLVRSYLVDPATAKAFLAEVSNRLTEFSDARAVGEAPIQAGHLTEYQLARVLAGSTTAWSSAHTGS